MASTLAQRIKTELTALQDGHGRLQSNDVWQWARRNRRSALYTQYNWNVQKAAEAHWNHVSRQLITRYLTIEVVSFSKHITSVAYVRDVQQPSEKPGFISLTSDLIQRRDAEKIVLAELDRIESCIERARGVAAVLDQRHAGVAANLQRMLQALVDCRDGVSGIAA